MFSSRFLSLLFLATFAGASTQHIANNKAAHHNIQAQKLDKRQNGRVFTLTESSEGQTFFDAWDFWNFPDPTHGTVNYVDRDTAFGQGLAYVRADGVAVMRVDNTTFLAEGQGRNSVRIHSKKKYGQGLFIADILQMPYGCSVWPAFWSNGDNWPAGGEIDIIEGTQNTTINHSTLHTLPGCTLDTTRQNGDSALYVGQETFTGSVVSEVCDASVNFNAGCGIQNTDEKSYGYGMNSVGGGVYATLWDATGIRVWYFRRNAIPEDITNKSPNPDNWGAPSAFWSTNSCPMSQFFTDQTFIFNITLCGDLANATFGQNGCPGTCNQFVTDPNNFRAAMWKVNYFRVYN